jgi:YHS domain-containing protein
MKTRVLGIVVALMSMWAIQGWAADEKADTAGKCPVSGEAASKEHARDFDGGKVYFCCEKCPVAFEKDSKKFAAKAHLQMDVTGQLTEIACPFTGKKLNPEQTVEVGGVKVAFCCGNCKKAALAMDQNKLIDKVFTNISKSFKVVAEK